MPITQALGILLLVGGIILIRAFAKRIGSMPVKPPVDAGEVAAMHELLGRMEQRINTLERILDAEDPKWRTRM